MFLKKILQYRDQGFGISKAFVLIRGIRFLFHYDIRMCFQEILVIKSDIPYNAKPIGDNTEFKGVAKMPVNVHLLDGGIGSGVGRHRTISCLVRVKRIIQVMGFLKSFELPDDAVGIFGVVFFHPGFNAGGIKQDHGSFFQINLLANWFGKVYKTLKHVLQIWKEGLFKACKFRSIGNNSKAAEVPEFLREFEKQEQKAVCGNGENTL